MLYDDRIDVSKETNPTKSNRSLPKTLPKNFNTLLFYSSLYLNYLRSCCENIPKLYV